ncbi:CDP-diacylglycerol--glycerol-3-phosphate 3-phosphatidyltransferase [Mycoplasma sp. 125]|uniref:CDP-diacylglycerol--glycerol-3-phosphate 3-phosphatidyltransferase n=1 Tax=Mycoplasma sp. 125 TaxID=3447505 RepID=UPI003F65E25F
MKKIKDIKKSKNNSPHIKKFGIANWLTVLRIILMIPFIFLMSSAFFLIIKHNGTFWYDGIKIVGNQKYSITLSIIYWLNVSIFIIAMVTDFIDGHIARKTKTISQFGKIFDPIADKIATIMMLLFISIMNYSFLPIVVLFIIRDILVDGARVYAVKKDIKVAANWWGKIKTIIVSLAIITIAFSAPWFTNFDNDLGKYVSNDKYILYVNIPLIVGLILSWISGIIYLVKYLKGITKQYLEDISKKNNDDIKNPDITKDNIIIEPIQSDSIENKDIEQKNNSEQISHN